MRASETTMRFWQQLVVGGLAISTLSIAYAQGSSSDLLNQLPESERRAVLESLMRSGADFEDQPVEFPETVTEREPIEGEEPQVLEMTIAPESTLVIDFMFTTQVTPEEEAAVDKDRRLARLLGSHYFELDRNGFLHLEGVADIPLLGLTEEQAEKRIHAEEALRFFTIRVSILPISLTGARALKPFGYELFSGVPSTFAPATDIPVPPDYVLGPGDTIQIQLFGKENRQYYLVVTRDGTLNFPEIGPVQVAGLAFQALREELTNRINQQMIGVQASITMGTLRSIRIFVLGDAIRPGSYTISGLSTMTNALFQSGGIKEIGTLRNIQLKRSGRLIQTLDLYDLLLRGDTSADARLLPGDVIFIPPIGPTIGVDGEVRRPAIYELKGERTVSEVVKLAGGILPTAFPAESKIERINARRERVVLRLDLSSSIGKEMTPKDGDLIRVPSILDRLENSVLLTGHVYRPGAYQWHEGMRISDLIPDLADLKPKADPDYILIRRVSESDKRITALSVSLSAALAQPGSDPDLLLQPKDRVMVFDLELGRAAIIEPLLVELDLQADPANPFEKVTVAGRVRVAGNYPLEPDMRVSDLLRAGGNLDDSAYSLDAELTRYSVIEGGVRQTQLVAIDLAGVIAGDRQSDIRLNPYDLLVIKEIPEWHEQQRIEIIGEVRFPGHYPIKPGETMSSVIRRAGGLTEFAFPEGSVFLREDLRDREQQQIEILISRLERDLAALSLQALQGDPNAAQAQSVGQSLLVQLRTTAATGRLVIDLARVVSDDDKSYDILLRDSDQLLVPSAMQEVTIIGEVQFATSHVYQAQVDRDMYINMSGGMTRNADDKNIYVVRASGAVIASSSSRFFRRSASVDIRPGDTIVVPLDTTRVSKLTLWTSVTTIVYNLAIAVAAVNSF